jgi:hypothetical protein
MTATQHLKKLGSSPLFEQTATEWGLKYNPETSTPKEAVFTTSDGTDYRLVVRAKEAWTISSGGK